MEHEERIKNMFSKFLETKINQTENRNASYFQGALLCIFSRI